jgi:hypothetical protein
MLKSTKTTTFGHFGGFNDPNSLFGSLRTLEINK